MNDIYRLLNLNADILANFALQGRDIERNEGNDRILRKAARRLKEIENSIVVTSDRPNISQKSIDEVVAKMKADAKRGGGAEWTARELRIASYYLIKFQNSGTEFNHAIKLLEANWRDMFINGLAFFLINSWNLCSLQIRQAASRLLIDKLRNYNGGIRRYQQFRNHSDLFEDAGPMRMAALVAHKEMPLNDAPTLLGYKPSLFSHPYFSDVILCYIEAHSKSDLNFVEKIFDYHALPRTKQLAMAYLVEDAEDSCNTIQQDLVARCARRVMGSDISLASTWAPFTGATPNEEKKLKHAHELVTAWYARKSVEAFFEVACQDSRRRAFWIKYTDYVSDFRIVGSTAIRTMLQSDGRVAGTLSRCFIETSSRYSTTAALVLYIGNKVFVEFSDVGSLYIYNNTNRVITPVKRVRSIDNTKDLKQPSIGNAIDQTQDGWYGSKYYTHYQEGRVTHRGEWESRLSSWMRQIMKLEESTKAKASRAQQRYQKPTEYPPSSTNKSQPSLFDFSEKKTSTPITDTSESLVSPPYYGGKYRIVVFNGKYYLEDINSGDKAFLASRLRSATGKIYLGVADNWGYRPIIHQVNTKMHVIGYLRQGQISMLFKVEKYETGNKVTF